jgi:uroporphyrinogen-III synthase
MSGAAFFAIGPTTAAALHAAGLPVHGQAASQDAAGFIGTMRAYFGHTSASPEGGSPS